MYSRGHQKYIHQGQARVLENITRAVFQTIQVNDRKNHHVKKSSE